MTESPIQVLLKSKGKTLSWLAAELGLSVSAVSRKVSGERPWKLEEAKRAVKILKSLNKRASYSLLEME